MDERKCGREASASFKRMFDNGKLRIGHTVITKAVRSSGRKTASKSTIRSLLGQLAYRTAYFTYRETRDLNAVTRALKDAFEL